jgi:hypothetical protein
MAMIISPIPIVSGVFKTPITTILIGVTHYLLAGAIPIIHGTIHIMVGIHGVIIHGDGIPGTIRGVTVHIAAIHGDGATIAGIHPTTTAITTTVLTVMTAMKAIGAQEIQTQYMEVVEPALFREVVRTMNQV